MLVLAIALSAAGIITPTVQGKTGTSAQRVQGRIDFVGEVIKVDPAARSMTLRSGRNTVSFDISNPVLQGYGSVTAIKKGDRIGAGYTAPSTDFRKSRLYASQYVIASLVATGMIVSMSSFSLSNCFPNDLMSAWI